LCSSTPAAACRAGRDDHMEEEQCESDERDEQGHRPTQPPPPAPAPSRPGLIRMELLITIGCRLHGVRLYR
jgi:hypothetical protein